MRTTGITEKDQISELIQNICREYLGILRVYNKTSKKLKPLYNLNIIYDTNSESFVLNKGSKYYYLKDEEGYLSFDKIQRNLGQYLISNAVVDIYFTQERNSSSSSKKLLDLVKRTPKETSSEIDKTYWAYYKTLNVIIKEIEGKFWEIFQYEIVNENELRLVDLSGELYKKLAYIVQAKINQTTITLQKLSDGIFRNKSDYFQLQAEGFISVHLLTREQQNVLQECRSVRNLFLENPDPDSPSVKLKQFFKENIIKNPLPSISQTDTKISFTEDQLLVLKKIESDLLTVVKGSAGTGKTTTIVEGIVNAVRAGQRILIIAHPHKIVDNICLEILKKDPTLNDQILRLASKHTIEKVSSSVLDYHITKITSSSLAHTLERLYAAIEIEKDSKIREIQVELKNLLNTNPEEFEKLVNLSRKLCFSTAGGLRRYSRLLSPNTVFLDYLDLNDPEFDLVVIEDASDINFTNFVLACQFGHRWIITGDPNQVNPIIPNIRRLARLHEAVFPNEKDSINTLNDDQLKHHEFRESSKHHRLAQGSKLLKMPALNTMEYSFPSGLTAISFQINFRFSHSMSEAIKQIFPNITFDTGFIGEEKFPLSNIYKEPIMVINSHPGGRNLMEVEVKLKGDRSSYENRFEIEKIFEIIRDILVGLNGIDDNKITIGISTYYTAQKELLHKILLENSKIFGIDYREGHFCHRESTSTIFIDTVRNLGSREFDIVLTSFTRSIITGNVKNWQFLFSTLSRARFLNILFFDLHNYEKKLGRKSLSGRSNPWHTILDFAKGKLKITRGGQNG